MVRGISRTLLASLIALGLGAPMALAQDAPVRVRGTIERVEGDTYIVKARNGDELKVKLAEKAGVSAVIAATLADIKPGTYVGIAGMPQTDGSQKALEVLIFPEAMRGVGEGHYAWDLKPDSKMTNGNVADVKSVGKDRMLTVQYKGGEQKVLVPNNAKVVVFGPAERSELKKGSHIFCVAQRQPDGSLAAARVNVGVKGTTPPM